MSPRETSATKATLLKWGAPVALLFVIAAGYLYIQDQRKDEQEAADIRQDERNEAREERRQARLSELREESADMMPEPLEGIALGMTRQEARAVRPGMQPRLGADAEEGYVPFEEELQGGARAVFLFAESTDLLSKIQVLSQLPNAEAMGAHLRFMNNAYGPPSGIWDCPATDDLETRRFMWERERTAIADIFLVYGDRISVTLYVAPIETMARSLQRSRCRRISREEFDDFPVNDPQAIIEEAQP